MNKDEETICELLSSYSLLAERFSKEEGRQGKTPDFRVLLRETLQFFCEVKSIDKDTWLDKQLDKAPSGGIAGGKRKDPIYNRLTDDIHTAIKQFDAVNEHLNYPNVLAFVNHDEMCGFLDLIAVLTGNALTDDGKSLSLFKCFSEGRIRDEKKNIHLFIWVDDFKPKRLLFGQTHERHHHLLCSLFGIDPSSIKQIDS
jgi:hypothetical protein